MFEVLTILQILIEIQDIITLSEKKHNTKHLGKLM